MKHVYVCTWLCTWCICTHLLLGAADALQVSDEGVLALVQSPLQLFEGATDALHRLVLPLRQLPGDLRHQLDGRRQLREPGGGHGQDTHGRDTGFNVR